MRSRARASSSSRFNYRLGVFGFLAHPELTKESGRNASGNYGMLDQIAALQLGARTTSPRSAAIRGNVTIFGESAGSFAVSALMASPLAHRAVPQRHRRERRLLLGRQRHARRSSRSRRPSSRA